MREKDILPHNLQEWENESVFKIDKCLAVRDRSRIWIQDTEIDPNKGVEIEFLNNFLDIVQI